VSPTPARLVAIDFGLSPDNDWRGIETHRERIDRLPFPDASFDTVICTHVLEHILDLRGMVSELRRVCRRRLIIVVPREREYRYTFNPHFHFFPYNESFLRAMIPLPPRHECVGIGRDIFYTEERDG
jgi:ubiquinone/menaquinone biosynthesis C-methylase UbiE